MSPQQLSLFPVDGEPPLTRHSPLGDALVPFEFYLRLEGRSPHTIDAFGSDLRLLVEFAGGDVPLKDFTTSKLNRFMEWIEYGRGIACSRKTYARRVTTLKVFFGFLVTKNILEYNPAEPVLQRSGAAPLQPVLMDEDIERALTFAASLRLNEKKPDARPELLFRLLLDTGIKKSECMALTPEHIIKDDPTVPVLIVRHTKRVDVYKERKIALDPDWLTVLDDYREQYRPQDTLFDCTARNLEYVLRDLAEGAGTEEKVSFEVLRWTCAVRDYRRGMDLERLREKMGLSRISWRETSDKIKRLAALYDQP